MNEQTINTEEMTEGLGWLTPRDKDDALRLHALVSELVCAREYLDKALSSLDSLSTILIDSGDDTHLNINGIVTVIHDSVKTNLDRLDWRLEQILPPDADTKLFKELSGMLKAEKGGAE